MWILNSDGTKKFHHFKKTTLNLHDVTFWIIGGLKNGYVDLLFIL